MPRPAAPPRTHPAADGGQQQEDRRWPGHKGEKHHNGQSREKNRRELPWEGEQPKQEKDQNLRQARKSVEKVDQGRLMGNFGVSDQDARQIGPQVAVPPPPRGPAPPGPGPPLLQFSVCFLSVWQISRQSVPDCTVLLRHNHRCSPSEEHWFHRLSADSWSIRTRLLRGIPAVCTSTVHTGNLPA